MLFAFQSDSAVTVYLLNECLVLQYLESNFIDFPKRGTLYSFFSPPPPPLSDCWYSDVKNRFIFALWPDMCNFRQEVSP
jgi:hypothetical protein